MTISDSKAFALLAVVTAVSAISGPTQAWAACEPFAQAVPCEDEQQPSTFATIVRDVEQRIAIANGVSGTERQVGARSGADVASGPSGQTAASPENATESLVEFGVPAEVLAEAAVPTAQFVETDIANALGAERTSDPALASTTDQADVAISEPAEETASIAEYLGFVHRASKRSDAANEAKAAATNPSRTSSVATAEHAATSGVGNGRTIAESIKSMSDEPPLVSSSSGNF